SVAPVFLLTGIAGLLSVMTHRLARVIDRTRLLESLLAKAAAREEPLVSELRTLRARMHMINRAVSLCTFSALLVASVIASLFLGALFGFHFAPAVAGAFVIAMLLLIGGLINFLWEVHLATRFMRTDAGR
ncbi:MAG: DUF2721 domain-containing protein, partial [Gemmatimonadetes bacterium]|nr:DUF2721 domain-containing protein [Gemmatimonadota bacterium]